MKKSQPNFEKMQTVSSNNVEQQSKSYNYKKERGKNLKKKKKKNVTLQLHLSRNLGGASIIIC